MYATRLKAWAGTILGLGLLLGSLSWLPGPLISQPSYPLPATVTDRSWIVGGANVPSWISTIPVGWASTTSTRSGPGSRQ